MCGMVRPESRHATALRGARSRFLDEPSHFSLNLLCLKRARENTGKVVLRKVSVLFAISSMPKRAIGKRTESFSEWTILFALNLLCRKRAIEQTGQSRFEKGTRPFLFIVSAVFSYGAFIS